MASPKLSARAAGISSVGFGLLTLLLRLPFLQLPFALQDEGYYATAARLSLSGRGLYSDLSYVRPPLLNAVYAASKLGSVSLGIGYDVSVRIFSGIFAAFTVAILSWFMFRRLGAVASLIASVFCAIAMASLALQNEANAETWMLLPYAASGLVCIRAAEYSIAGRERNSLYFLAGVLAGVAVLFKEVAAVGILLPVVIWLSLGGSQVRRWAVRTAVTFAGLASVLAGWLAVAAWQGQALDYMARTWLRGFIYASSSALSRDLLAILTERATTLRWALVIPGAAILLLYVASIAAARERVGLETSDRPPLHHVAFGWLVLSVAAVASSGRFYEHYFVQLVPALALLVGSSLDAIVSVPAFGRFGKVLGWTLAALVVGSSLAAWVRDVGRVPTVQAARERGRAIAAEIDRVTPPEGSYFIWGTVESAQAYADSKHFSNVIWSYFDLGRPGGAVLFGQRFPSQGDILLAALEEGPLPTTIVLTAPVAGYDANPPNGQGGSLLQVPDDPRVEPELVSLLRSRYRVVSRESDYTLLISVR